MRFEDGSVEEIDVIVYCTGYKVTFPFFDEDFISAPDNDLPLFRRVFKPGIDNLALHRAAAAARRDHAARRGAGALDRVVPARRVRLPAAAEMEADIDDERERMFTRYVASKRHTMQVDFDDYLYELGKELKAGARSRARSGLPRCPSRPAPAPARRRPRDRRGGRPDGKREQTKAHNRAAILVAAREVFAELGYDAAGVRDVIRRTELASGTFYNYFPTRKPSSARSSTRAPRRSAAGCGTRAAARADARAVRRRRLSGVVRVPRRGPS